MRETYQPPTTAPAGPPHDRTHPRHSREGGNLPRYVQTLEETALLPPSTEIDTMRQSSTSHNGNSCPRVTRARGNRRSVSLLSAWIAAGSSQRIQYIAWSCRPPAVMPQ